MELDDGKPSDRIVMAFQISAPLLILLLAAASAPGLAQSAEEFPDANLTPQQWQQRVEEAHRRAEYFRAHPPTSEPISTNEAEKEAAGRAIKDPTLQNGDIVSTSQGFVVFTGRNEEHKPGDFRSTPNPLDRR